MSQKMPIDDALKQLNAGQFSFRMSDGITHHIAAQSQQIEELLAQNNRLRFDIMQQALHVHLLESEVGNLKTLLLGTFRLKALLSQTSGIVITAKEKLTKIDRTVTRRWIAEIQEWLHDLGESIGQVGQRSLQDAQPHIREAVKSFKKIRQTVFSKMKAVA